MIGAPVIHPSMIDASLIPPSVINPSVPPPSLLRLPVQSPSVPTRPVPRTLQELITKGHVKDNGEPPQPNVKLFRYYCSYCPGPVQIGFCNCEKGKKYAYR
jgi:hypothetical protein